MSTKSKFSGIFESRRTEAPEEPKTPEPPPTAPRKPTLKVAKVEAEAPVTKRPRGRPGGQGKRINPAYTQVTAYIPENLHTQTKINLLRSGKREFSELVEELLDKWNRGQPETQVA